MEFFIVCIGFILVGITGVLLSFPMSAMIKRFCSEEKIIDKSIIKDFKFDPIIAIATSILFILLFVFFGISEKFFVFAFLSVLLIMDFYTDIKAQIIPNGLNMTGFIVGLVYLYIKIVFDFETGIDLLIGMFVGGGIFLLIALFALIVYRKEGMGLGDVKLMGMLGMFLGSRNIFQVFILSFTIGAIVSILLLITKKKKMDDYIPFGPFIVLATIITMFIPYTSMLELLGF